MSITPIERLLNHFEFKDKVIIRIISANAATLQIIGRNLIKIALYTNNMPANSPNTKSELRYYSSLYRRDYSIISRSPLELYEYTETDYQEFLDKLSLKIKSYIK